MIVHNIPEIFEKFKVSWGVTGLAAVTPAIDLMPVVSQIVLVASLQMISIMVDYVRNRLKLRKTAEPLQGDDKGPDNDLMPDK